MKRRTSSNSTNIGSHPRDFSIMASGLPDVKANLEQTETTEECPGKKKSKFQTFKNFFVKKKRKEPTTPVGENLLKSSQSSDNVNTPEKAEDIAEEEFESGAKVNMGNKAMSHDSVFISDSPSSDAKEMSSQESIHGKVKSLQLQLKGAIRLGSPPALINAKKCDDTGALSEDDGLPRSPPELSTLHNVLTGPAQRSSHPVQRNSSLSLEGTDSEDEQMSFEASRPVSPLSSSLLMTPSRSNTALPTDFSIPASPLACLDNSAAKHRIAVKHKACAKRKPASKEVLGCDTLKVLNADKEKDRKNAIKTEQSVEENKENADLDFKQVDGEESSDKDINTTDKATVQSISTEGEDSADVDSEPQSARQVLADLAPDCKDTPQLPSPSESSPDTETISPSEQVSLERHSPQSEILQSMSEESLSSQDLDFDAYENEVLDASHEPDDEKPTSFLEEVLNSLECPLTSEYVLEPETVVVEIDFSEESKSPENVEDLVQDDLSQELPCTSPSEACQSVQVGYEAPDILEEEKGEIRKELEEADQDSEEACPTEDHDIQEMAIPEEEGLVEDLSLINETKIIDVELEGCEEVKCSLGGEEDKEMEESDSEYHPVKSLKCIAELSVQSVIDNCPPSQLVNQSLQMATSDQSDTFKIVSGGPSINEDEPFSNVCREAGSGNEPSGSSQGQEESCKRPISSGGKVKFTIAPAWQRSLSGGSQRDLQFMSPIVPELFEEFPSEDKDSENKCTDLKTETVSASALKPDLAQGPDRIQTPSHSLSTDQPACDLQGTETPFGIKLRKTSALLKYSCESLAEATMNPAQSEPPVCSNEPPKASHSDFTGSKPALPTKPDLHEDSSVKFKRTPEITAHRTSRGGLESPSWITVAKQKQKIFKDNSLDETSERTYTLEKDDLLRKSSLPLSTCKDTKEQVKMSSSPVTVVSCSQEISKAPAVEKEGKRPLAHIPTAPLSQEEPPWLALAKKKAKAWSEMPQIVQ
ncbi:CRACD-like protein isoform X2 [Amia ocellicauda]|uniref:CRACD-like protein isoform X2 n=1 Tax=Amia ocellicauda TaxID=2972642 RepID=UPI0034643345